MATVLIGARRDTRRFPIGTADLDAAREGIGRVRRGVPSASAHASRVEGCPAYTAAMAPAIAVHE